jgi:asparagine synthase (glutamine-hydrolysing)
MPWHYDEPFSDYSCYPTYHLCREARQSITVALTGDGADEIFGGYRKYQRLVRRAELSRALPIPAARVLAAVAQHTRPEGDHWRRTLRQYGLGASEMLADMLCVGFPLPLLREVARGPLAEALRHYDPQRLVGQLLREAPPSEVGLLNSMRHLDFALTLPGDMLVKVDRASMAVSLEARPIFLHRDVMELAARIPAEGLANREAAKLALKSAVRPWLPDALIDRRKQGFAMPLPEWLGGDSVLANTMNSAGSSGPLGELLDMARVNELFEANAKGMGSLTGLVYAVFVLDQWFKQWMPT